ncbi:MAG TPA: alpha/beta fold hydrolase [Thermoplasmata archaeon]|nr:alpha/beta fold hydrolase [Thermoplasmata archaeon]
MVFVHGYPLHRGMWTPQLTGLSARHRILLLDLPGYGSAATDPVPDTLEGFGEAVRAVIEGETGGHASVVGHSFGGYVALRLYEEHPELFDRLLLVSTRSGADTPEAKEKRLATARRLAAPTEHLDIDEVAKSLVAESTWNAGGPVREQVRSIVAAAPNVTVARTLTAIANRADLTPVLAKVRVPSLVVWGASDRLIPPAQTKALVGGIPGARGTEVPGAGHLSSLETPTEFDDAVRAFLVATDDAARR